MVYMGHEWEGSIRRKQTPLKQWKKLPTTRCSRMLESLPDPFWGGTISLIFHAFLQKTTGLIWVSVEHPQRKDFSLSNHPRREVRQEQTLIFALHPMSARQWVWLSARIAFTTWKQSTTRAEIQKSPSCGLLYEIQPPEPLVYSFIFMYPEEGLSLQTQMYYGFCIIMDKRLRDKWIIWNCRHQRKEL